MQDGQVLDQPFLDITDLVGCCGEHGLLSVAFDPDYARTGLLYVDYTDAQRRHRRRPLPRQP